MSVGFSGFLVHCAKRISDDDDDDEYKDDDGKYIDDDIEERTVGPIAARESRLGRPIRTLCRISQFAIRKIASRDKNGEENPENRHYTLGLYAGRTSLSSN